MFSPIFESLTFDRVHESIFRGQEKVLCPRVAALSYPSAPGSWRVHNLFAAVVSFLSLSFQTPTRPLDFVIRFQKLGGLQAAAMVRLDRRAFRPWTEDAAECTHELKTSQPPLRQRLSRILDHLFGPARPKRWKKSLCRWRYLSPDGRGS
jgi:hypothetical protein